MIYSEIVENIKKNYLGSSTQELLAIWQTKDTVDEDVTEECFEAIRQILVERGVGVQNQVTPDWAKDLHLPSETIMDNAFNLMTIKSWNYTTARSVARVISFFGWLFVGICAFSELYILNQAGSILNIFNGSGGVFFLVIFMAAIAGFLLVAAGQVLRATVDNADNTGQILALIKSWTLDKNKSTNNTKI